MKKSFKRLLCAALSLAMVAGSIVLPAAADAAFDGSITVDGTKATINAPQAAVAVVATYSEGKLTKAVAKDVAEGETTIDVAEGDKIMLWDSLKGMTPLAEAVTAGGGAPAETTAPSETAAPGETTAPGGDDEAIVAGDTVIKTWKFDFGAEGQTPEAGYTAVAPDRNYITEKDYGFIGIDEDSYKIGNRYDGFGNQQGQVIELSAGGTTGLNDAIGSIGEDSFGNAGDIYYPTRFVLAAPDETYYRVKATVTTLDPTKDAEISLYTERKHPIFTDTEVKAGETKTVIFSVRPTPIYYEKSDPKGTIADNMVNIAVQGTNSALAALEIQQVQEYPVFWVLGDSTVTDGNCDLPFFRLQNYTGVGTGLTKYLPSTIAMVNEGEGGLAAGDNYHFNMVKNRIKAGDYMYVEYGHNHKDDGPTGYVSNLDKYYNACHDVGAYLIIVSPIERINTFSGGAYQHTLDGFAAAGEKYVADKIAAGADDIAYVDLNTFSLDFYNKITTDNGGDANAIKYYFRTAKGGGVDQTHPNDAGAENLAYEFIKAAKAVTDETQKAVLAPILDNLTDETPNLVKEEIVAGGLGGTAWPTYQPPVDQEFPVVIKSIKFADDGTVESAKVKVQAAKIAMEAYGIIVITVYNEDGSEKGKIYAVDQVDNSTGYGAQTINNFRGDVTLGENDTYTAIVMQAVDSPSGLIVDEEANLAYSAVYEPAEIEEYILPGEDDDIETFVYYGQDTLTGSGTYKFGGSSGGTFTLGADEDGVTYSDVINSGTGNSWFLMRPFENLQDDEGNEIGTLQAGKYMIDVDMKYTDGSGLTFQFAENTTSSSPFVSNTFDAFVVGSGGTVTIGGQEAGAIAATEWTNIHYILDMDNGKASLAVAGGTPVEVDVDAYKTIDPTQGGPATLKHFVLAGARTTPFEVKLSNMTVAKLRSDKLPDKTLTIATADAAQGSTKITDEQALSVTVPMNTIKNITATPEEGYDFDAWKFEDGTVYSYSASVGVRLHEDISLTAHFKEAEYDPINYAYKEQFSTLSTATLATNGWTSPNHQGGATVESDDEHGNFLQFAVGSNNDRNVKKSFPTGAQLGVDYVLEFDTAITPGTNHSTDFVVFDSSTSPANNAHVDAGYILKLYNNDANSTTWTINGGSSTVEIASGAWVHVFIKVNKAGNTVDIKITNGDTTLFEGTEAINGTAVPGGINFLAGRYNAVWKIDNIRLYTADQIQ